VNDITDGAILTALGREMTKAVQRQSAAASNLANLETPGYRTVEPSFADALGDELQAEPLQRTDQKHLPGLPVASGTQLVGGLAERRDGNNVQLDRELLSMSQAAGTFSEAQTALAAKFRLVRYAINEGR
jgi:flagellar basal-body rod protein FlgB